MLVKNLIKVMHCTQAANIRIYGFDENKGTRTHITLYEQETKGHPDSLNIPDDVLNKEVNYYYMDHDICTRKENNEGKYEDLPYIELVLNFNICVKEVSSND